MKRTVQEWRAAVFRSRELRGTAKVLCLYLADYMGQDRTVKQSQRAIATALGVSPRAVRGYLADATEAGFLSPVAAARKDRSAAIYQGIFPTPQTTHLVGIPGSPSGGDPFRRTQQRTPGSPPLRGTVGTPGFHHYLGDHPPNATSLPSTTSTPEDRSSSGGTPAAQRAPGPTEVLRDGQQQDQDSDHEFDPRSGPIQEQPRPTTHQAGEDRDVA